LTMMPLWSPGQIRDRRLGLRRSVFAVKPVWGPYRNSFAGGPAPTMGEPAGSGGRGAGAFPIPGSTPFNLTRFEMGSSSTLAGPRRLGVDLRAASAAGPAVSPHHVPGPWPRRWAADDVPAQQVLAARWTCNPNVFRADVRGPKARKRPSAIPGPPWNGTGGLVLFPAGGPGSHGACRGCHPGCVQGAAGR